MTNIVAPKALLSHQVPLTLDSGDSAFILICTALVLFMTLPGLALFYAGMVRKKNLLATLGQVTGVAVVAAIVWVVIGYSLAFGVGPTEEWQALLGTTDLFMLQAIGMDTAYKATPKLPEFLWVAYQMTFAMITPALIVGAVAERMKFSALLLFSALWSLFVYAPICHWVWGGGFLGTQGVLDFAGGAVVHINAGVAGLVAALILGPRRGFGRDMMAPHNLSLTYIGGAMLLVGWIGFNAGSEWAADSIAAVATLNTILAAMTGIVGWVIMEWFERKKPTLLGMVSGLVAGLVAITPAAGFVHPTASLAIGLLGGAACYWGATKLKNWLKYDDSLDAFGVHGIGGIVGALLTGLLASEAINPLGVGADLGKQALGIVVVMAWSAGITAAICFLIKSITGLRVSEEAEIEGLDMAEHGEQLHP